MSDDNKIIKIIIGLIIIIAAGNILHFSFALAVKRTGLADCSS